MGSITVRNIDESIKQGARLEGIKHGRSMEAEIRALLERTYRPARDERTARLRALSPKEAIAHLRRIANGADIERFIPARDLEDVELPEL